MSSRRGSRGWFRGRNYILGPQLDTFLVCAASGVIVNRLTLIILGYPQIGSRKPDGIHISHSIYGGFAMMFAACVALAFLNPSVRWFVAVVGGLGFGWYVDELGKYVSNAGYLFEPALALIYVVFVTMFLVIRALAAREFSPDDAVANALESLQAAALGTLTDPQRADAITRLDRLGPDTAFARQVRTLLADAPSSPALPPGRWRRARNRVRARYERWTQTRGFILVLEVFFIVVAASTVAGVIALSLDGAGIKRPSEKVASIASTVAGLLVIVGVFRLRKSRLSAFRWFERGVLIWILVVQVYMFADRQFEAVMGLAVDLAIWVMLRSAIAVEEQRQRTETATDPPPAPTAVAALDRSG